MSHPFVSMGAVLALSAAAPAIRRSPRSGRSQDGAGPGSRRRQAGGTPGHPRRPHQIVGRQFQEGRHQQRRRSGQVRDRRRPGPHAAAGGCDIGTRIQAEFNKLDTDRNGQLSLAEFKAAAPAPKAARGRQRHRDAASSTSTRTARSASTNIARRCSPRSTASTPTRTARSAPTERQAARRAGAQELSLRRYRDNGGRRSDAPPVSYGWRAASRGPKPMLPRGAALRLRGGIGDRDPSNLIRLTPA